MATNQKYYELWFENFDLGSGSGRRDRIQLRLVKNQNLPVEVVQECNNKKLDPYDLLTECSKSLFYDYPLQTRYLLKVKLTNREGKGTFFYTSYKWTPIKIKKPE